ncbi:MAG: hypothetical protein FWD91_01335, partial [Treponema sp.]|nr:hypothetical protein [Treponema sp.]
EQQAATAEQTAPPDTQTEQQAVVITTAPVRFAPQEGATVPELRNVMPNSWRLLTRLTGEEQQAFWEENPAVLSEITEERMQNEVLLGWHRWFENNDWNEDMRLEHYSIFRQEVGGDTFYRILVTDTASPDFLSRRIRFVQYLVYQNAIILGGFYNMLLAPESGVQGYFSSIDIIPGKEGARGVLHTGIMGKRDDKDYNEWHSEQYRNGQLFAWHQENASFYLMEDILSGNWRRRMDIEASDALVDPDVPLRYSVQNAFDGNPETAFVPNVSNVEGYRWTGITVPNRFLSIKKNAIINGSAENAVSYINNNRVRKLSVHYFGSIFHEIELSDDTLAWQIFESNNGGFSAIEFYPGSMCNNTPISGFNVYTETYGWLFGEIDEQ